MTRYEQETVINYNQEEAQVYTCNAFLIRRLDKLFENHSKITLIKSNEYSRTYSFPKKWIKVKPLRQLSDEKRSELAERAKRNFGKNGENE